MATFRSGNYVQYFPCRYASFGLSQIELNQPRLANAAANRCAQYLVELIIAQGQQNSSGALMMPMSNPAWSRWD